MSTLQPWRRSYGENIVYTDWRADNFLAAVQEVLETKLRDRVGGLGVEADHLNLNTHRKLRYTH